MLNINERMQKILNAPPKVLSRIDAILTGEDTTPEPQERENRLVTYTEAARRLNLSRPTIYRLVQSGRLAIVPLNGVNRVTIASINNLLTAGV